MRCNISAQPTPYCTFLTPSIPMCSLTVSICACLGSFISYSSYVNMLPPLIVLPLETSMRMLPRMSVLSVETPMHVLSQTPVPAVDDWCVYFMFCPKNSCEATLVIDLGNLISTSRVLLGITYTISQNCHNVATFSGLLNKSANIYPEGQYFCDKSLF